MKKFSSFFFFSFTLVLLLSSNAISQNSYDRYGDLKYRKWRVTLFPPLGTNGIAAPKYTAKYSINLLGGYHGGLDGFELGTLINYNKEYASGFQIAGLANATGGNLEGVNIAGLGNFSRSNMSGIQVSGLTNFSGGSLEGLQAAGGINFSSRGMSGLQAAGLANISKDDIDGLQAAGAFNYSNGFLSGLQGAIGANIARGSVEGLQASGFLNFAGNDLSGLQATGGGNIALDDMEGLMFSGLFNIATEYSSGLLITGGVNFSRYQEGLMISGGVNVSQQMEGLQIGGAFNYATRATGMQIGIINVAKEFEGASVGALSLYGNGRKNIDVRYADAGFTDVGITTGTHRVYNMVVFGYNTSLDRNVYRIGVGVGLEKNINDSFQKIESEKLFVNQEFTVLHHFEENWSKRTNLIFSYKYLLGKRFASGFSVYGGPSYNIQVTRVNGANDYTWYSLWSPEWKGRQYRMWVGFNIGIRFFKQKNLPPLDDYEFTYENDF